MFADVSEVLAASIIRAIRLITLMMEAATTAETSVNYQTSRHKTPEDSHLNTVGVVNFAKLHWAHNLGKKTSIKAAIGRRSEGGRIALIINKESVTVGER
jgi:hypothetical protein